MSFNWAFWGVVGIALGAAYLLWLFQRTMLGELKKKRTGNMPDLSWREIAVFAPLVVWVFWIGLSPQPYFRVLGVARGSPSWNACVPAITRSGYLPNPLEAVNTK